MSYSLAIILFLVGGLLLGIVVGAYIGIQMERMTARRGRS